MGAAGAAIGAGGLLSFLGGQEQARATRSATGKQLGFLRDVFRARSGSPLGQRLFGLLGVPSATGEEGAEVGPTGAEVARGITGARRRGVVRGAEAQRSALQNVLGRTGATGGIAAGALGQLARQRAGALADVEAGGLELERGFQRQDIGDTLNALQVLFPSPGGAVQGITGALGQTGGAGAGLAGIGSTLGTLGILGAGGFFGPRDFNVNLRTAVGGAGGGGAAGVLGGGSGLGSRLSLP
jgi:hypothetical protein